MSDPANPRSGAVADAPNATPPPAGDDGLRDDFLRDIVRADLAAGRHRTVVTRFPPEPNGYLHIGHAKSICLNFGVAHELGGVCHLRFDDSNPLTEDLEYVRAIQRDVQWLGFEWGSKLFFASDYFERLYELAEALVGKGLAYVDELAEDEIRAYRGTVTEPGRPSPWRDRPPADSLAMLRRMRAGEIPDGAAVLRARIDMAAANMKMRDPLLYRIRHAEHYRRGSDWCIYPMYDFIHPLSDAFEGITHSFCTLEFENNRELYDWLLAAVDWPEPRPRQYEFARLNLNFTVMSKRKLLELVEQGLVSGWDDPRMPTLSGLRRRGYTPSAIRTFCDRIGVAKAHSTVDVALLEHTVREDLNTEAPRLLGVLRPLELLVESWPEGEVEHLEAPFWPHDVPKEGKRALAFTRRLWIERDDFAEEPPKGWHRLSPGAEVRLRYGYVVRCTGVDRDDAGNVVRVRCTHDPATKGGSTPDGRRVPGTLHWVSAAHAVDVEVRLYDRLFRDEQPDAAADYRAALNPDSLQVLTGCKGEPALAEVEPGGRVQLERQGYFYREPEAAATGALAFNRIVTLKDTWARQAGRGESGEGAAARPPRGAGRARAIAAEATAAATAAGQEQPTAAATVDPLESVPPALRQEVESLRDSHGIAVEDGRVLAGEPALLRLFEAAVAAGAPPRVAGSWVVHELPRELREAGVAPGAVPFGGAEIAELLALLAGGSLSSTAGRQVLAGMVRGEGSPGAIVTARGLAQVSEEGALVPIVERVMAGAPGNVTAYRAGKTGLLGWFVGQVMKESGGRANPQLLQRLLRERLEG
jgi:glutaminyl-tRNA synthetase